MKKFFFLFAGFLPFHCATTSTPSPTPEALYESALSASTPSGIFRARDCFRVNSIWEEIREKYPYHQKTVDVEEILARCYLEEGRPEESLAHFKALYLYYQNHIRAPEFLFGMIRSYKEMEESYDLDLTFTRSLWVYADEFLRRFPSHPLRTEVEKYRKEAREKIARRELSIARFYLKRGYPLSARDRLLFILKEFPETSSAKESEDLLRKKWGEDFSFGSHDGL